MTAAAGSGPGRRVAGVAAGLALLAAGAWAAGAWDLVSPARAARLGAWVQAQGPWGPVLYIGGYVLLELVFFPALPLTLLGGLAFGPLLGTAYVSVAATLSAVAAFLVARYALGGTVERWVARSPRLARIDQAVALHGWRILVITRLVPLFPYNLQNFAYGLTRLRLLPYAAITWACMLPATAAYTLAGSALAEGGRDPRRMLLSLGGAGIVLVLLSLLPGWLARRHAAARALLGAPAPPGGMP